jgi:circadian clock protein KaiB
MKTASNAPSRRPAKAAYRFLLFVAGDEFHSRQAKRNLQALCEEDLDGTPRVEIVDVLEDFESASKHRVLLTPTLLSLKPGPEVRIIGNLNDRDRVRKALRMEPGRRVTSDESEAN